MSIEEGIFHSYEARERKHKYFASVKQRAPEDRKKNAIQFHRLCRTETFETRLWVWVRECVFYLSYPSILLRSPWRV